MPFKSMAQMRKFAAMVKTGEISQETFDKWVKHTKNMKRLPKRLKKKKK